jgi:hypothetical protein
MQYGMAKSSHGITSPLLSQRMSARRALRYVMKNGAQPNVLKPSAQVTEQVTAQGVSNERE